jgi:hypothetical protein
MDNIGRAHQIKSILTGSFEKVISENPYDPPVIYCKELNRAQTEFLNNVCEKHNLNYLISYDVKRGDLTIKLNF